MNLSLSARALEAWWRGRLPQLSAGHQGGVEWMPRRSH